MSHLCDAEHVACLNQMHVGRTIVRVEAWKPPICEYIRWWFDDGSFLEWHASLYHPQPPVVPQTEGRLFKEHDSGS